MLKHLLIFYLFCKEKRNDTPDEVIAAVLKVSEIQFQIQKMTLRKILLQLPQKKTKEQYKVSRK